MPKKHTPKVRWWYCATCGWTMSAIKRSVHLTGQAHQKWLRQPLWTVVRAHEASLRGDRAFTSVTTAWRTLTLASGQEWSIALFAKDDLGNYTVARVGARNEVFIHQIFPHEITSWSSEGRIVTAP